MIENRSPLCPARRQLLVALPGVALLPVVLAACSSSSQSSPAPSTPAAAGNGNSANGNSGSGNSGANGSKALGTHVTVAAESVPVGNAVVIAAATPYVVAQPTAGEFVAFSAVCTHMGATVTAGDGLTLVCPAHGSEFDAANGSVERGPAMAPLPAVPVKDVGGTLYVG